MLRILAAGGTPTAADHEAVIKAALAATPGINPTRPGKKVLIRTDGAGGTKELLWFLHRRGVSYSIGWTLPAHTPQLYRRIPERVWQSAYDADGRARDGADVAELTDLLTPKGYPPGMRVIVRRERPHPGAQLRFDDVHGYRLTAFVTNSTRGQLADLELRHRRRARCEDRIRIAKDCGLTNLPLQGFAQNRLWLLIVQLANDLLAWMGLLAFADHRARRWEPKALRHRLFTIAATLAHTGRQRLLHIKATAPWAQLFTSAHDRLATLAPP